MTPSQRARAHELLDALLDVLVSAATNDVPTPPASKPRRRRRTAVPSLPEPDDVAKQKARSALRRRGVHVE